MTNASTDEIHRALDTLLAELERIGWPLADKLAPGLPEAELRQRASKAGLALHDDIFALLSWRNGCKADADSCEIMPGFFISSWDQSLTRYRMLTELGGWDRAHFPILADDAGDMISVRSDVAERYGELSHRISHEGDAYLGKDLPQFIQAIISEVKRGGIFVDDSDAPPLLELNDDADARLFGFD